ncbi:response regulator [Thermodesulfobacteriota bacterium]
MKPIPKILVVDDDPLIVSLIEKTLETTGYQIVTAYDGEEALQKVEDERPDIIILDVMMPKKDGLEVCRTIKENEETRLLPVVMLTSKDFIEDKVSGLEQGADDYITKPFNPKEFLARIKGLVERHIYRSHRAEEEKLEALEKLVESVAHEVRNPIVAIGGFARRIRDRLPQGDIVRTYADHITHEVERLETMVKQIINLKTIVVSAREHIAVNAIVDMALDEFSGMFELKTIALRKSYSTDLPMIRGDVPNLKTAFHNIIENAIEAMEDGGTLEVITVAEDGRVCIRLVDSGKGIPKSEIAQVARPFYTSKMSGAGMGLTMVKHIVTLHDGTVAITSKFGQGTSVELVLPAVSADHVPDVFTP